LRVGRLWITVHPWGTNLTVNDRDNAPGRPTLKVLIAERHRMVAQSLSKIVTALGQAEVAAEVTNADDLLDLTSRVAPDVVIVDLEMSPNCSLVAGVKALAPDARVIVMADRMARDADALVSALASGAVGAIYKEASLEELARALTSSSTRSPVVADEAAGLLVSSYLDAMAEKRLRDLATIEALAAAVEARDLTTGRHLFRVKELALNTLEAIDSGLAHNEEVAYGFTLHDVGKIGIPDAILNKPGPLDGPEWEVMRGHPELGLKIVEPIGFSHSATDVILCHHERWDGTGYPAGLGGDDIPLAARVFTVADAYDAMTTDRPYRTAMDKSRALAVIDGRAGTHFDPEIAKVFIDLTD
jgi:response regulator RpfG family c-di-GMP phosphodiesterase